MTSSFDVSVIGAGPGGVTAALEAASAGHKTCLIEKNRIGGVCLQTGCIPSKTLLHAAEIADTLQSAVQWGVAAQAPRIQLEKLLQKKSSVIAVLEKGLRTQLEKSGVTLLQGEARLVSKEEIRLGIDTIRSKYVILATGSRPKELAGLPFDGSRIISSTEGLEPKKIPGRFLIVGGGVIGVEFASMYSAFGSKVMIVEMLDRLIATEDPEIAKRLEVSFKKRGIEIYLGDQITKLDRGSLLRATLKSGTVLEADQMLVAVGRTRNVEDLGVKLTANGAVEVDECLETPQKGIFAIGDLIHGPQLAHAASFEAKVAVANLREKKHPIDLTLIPNAIYTHPEVASVGLTLEKARGAKETKILMGALGRSHTEGAEEGMAKLVYEEGSGRILGGHLIGAHVTELISLVALAIKSRLTLKDLADVVYPHPTLSEMFENLARQCYKGSSLET